MADKDSTILIDTGAWKVKATLGTVGIIAVVVLAFMFHFEAGIAMLGFASVGVWRGVVWVNNIRRIENENIERIKNQTRREKLETDLIEQQLEQEKARTDEYNLRKWIIETRIGVFRFSEFDQQPTYYPASAKERRDVGLIAPPDQDKETIYNFIDVVLGDDPVSIIGGQKCGKTNAAVAAASRSTGLRLMIAVRDEHHHHFDGLEVYAEERKAGSVRAGFERVLELYTQRHPAVVIFDDWINLVDIAQDVAEKILTLAATQFVSHGVKPFFLLQGDGIDDWGLKGSARLKNNFLKVEIPDAIRDETGQVISRARFGLLWFPGNRSQSHQVKLPGKVAFPNTGNMIFKNNLDRRIYEAIAAFDPGDVISFTQLFDAEHWGMSKPTFIKEVKRLADEYNLSDVYQIGAEIPLNLR